MSIGYSLIIRENELQQPYFCWCIVFHVTCRMGHWSFWS